MLAIGITFILHWAVQANFNVTKKQVFKMKVLSNVLFIVVIAVITISHSACNSNSNSEKQLQVTATAYTLRQAETKKGHKGLSAWGDQLVPGMKSIAVSRDLIKVGLRHKTEVRIDGLVGTYIVRDKMNKRWRNKIDIFMGNNLTEALEWGGRKVIIRWYDSEND